MQDNPEPGRLGDEEIAALVARHPLPAGVEDVVVNREQLAQALGTSTNTVDKWLANGMPYLSRGGNGQAYELQLSACWAWKQARDDGERARTEAAQRAVAAMRLALVGGQHGESIDALSPREKREIFETTRAYEEFKRQRNELIQRGEVVAMLEDLFGLIRDALNSAPDRVERQTGIDPKAVDALISICDDTLSEARRKIEEFFSARPVRDERRRETLFDA